MSEPTATLPDSSPTSWRRQVLTAFGPVVGLAAVLCLFAALRFTTFVTGDNAAIILQQTAVIGVAALGMTLVIIAGGIDLSAGSVIALGTVVIALLLRRGASPLLAALGGIGASALCGACSGLLITRLRLLPFVVTLGMMGVLRGAAKGLSGEQPVYPDETWLNRLMQLGGRGGLPPGVWLMLGLGALLALALRYTRFGRHVFAVGSSEPTARLCGVPVQRVHRRAAAVRLSDRRRSHDGGGARARRHRRGGDRRRQPGGRPGDRDRHAGRRADHERGRER